MEPGRAKELLEAERARIEKLLVGTRRDATEDRATANESGEIADPAERLVAEQVDDAVVAELQQRLDAIARAEQRLADGTYGISTRSGLPIPDERLEAEPTAELTAEEQARTGQ